MHPERVLKLLDSLDGLACAARLVCAGYWGRRLRTACFGALLGLGLAVARLSGWLAWAIAAP
jgi:hypothetical protein